ncbi:MAG: CpsB/CapC family capsule biosynthesis tyrosine phosphatase [Pseudomonadota bacterium]
MIDLHSHILPAIDDGAADLDMALVMARMAVADGVRVQACTPHILPGLYHNSGPDIRAHVAALQQALNENDIPLHLVTGADVHICPDFVAGLRDGRYLTLADTRYVLVEPPHNTAPARLEDLFASIQAAGYVPILTHPERLKWIRSHYPLMERLTATGVWMQITTGSLTGAFGREPLYWAERMLDEGAVHILASDAHNTDRRPPNMRAGYECASVRVGESEARHLVETRPMGILQNVAPQDLPLPVRHVKPSRGRAASARTSSGGDGAGLFSSVTRGVRRLIKH